MLGIRDVLEETRIAINANKGRSPLTTLGIVVAITAVVVMMAVGQGAQMSIQANIQAIGANLISIAPGAQRGLGYEISGGRGSARTLTNADVDALSSTLSNITAIAPSVRARAQVNARSTNTSTDVNGVSSSF